MYLLEHVPTTWKLKLLKPLFTLLRTRNFDIVKLKHVVPENRINGYDWPANAKTMVGLNRLSNVEFCLNNVITNSIEGDFVETGVWRGGVIILMAALLELNGVSDKNIWAFDSFEGMPIPNPQAYPMDAKSRLHKQRILKASMEDVINNFKAYDIGTERVHFVKGWFKDTIPLYKNEISKISLLRLDADYYESTILALEHLYPKVSVGGYVIIDDFNAFQYCKAAVLDYRKRFNITEPILEIDKEAVYWKKVNETN